jgi:type VI secretion system secreted protein VgrG
MAEYRQSGRFLTLETPLGPDQLIVKRFKGHETISQLFDFQLECVAENATNVDFSQMIGQKVTFGVVGAEDRTTPRYFNGIIVRMSQGARDKDFTDYNLTVAPKIWELTRKYRSRMFQHITIPDILKKVLEGYDVTYEIQGQWERREYCLQHQETDFDFVSRLMEEEGIYYFFKHSSGKHTMVVANTPQSHSDIPGNSKLIFEGVKGGGREEERISVFNKQQTWGSGKWTQWDHHFQLPHKKLDANQTVIDTVQSGKVSHKLKLAGNENMEVYDNPGRYAQRFEGIDKSGGEKAADLQKIFQDNRRTVGIRMQSTEWEMLGSDGVSNCRQLSAGHKFTVQRHYNADGAYVLYKVEHSGYEASIRSDMDGSEEETHYRNSFTCFPLALPFRPQCKTRRPLICGLQSAVVVGPAGEEIFTDKYGRVKVQFHWDRDGKNDADSSCWLRVASGWAGAQWGMISIPRIGQEVVVAFIEGDVDRPIVIGSVRNPDQMPNYELPKYKEVSSWRSKASKGGAHTNFNELRMQDSKGKEQLFIHSEKNWDNRCKEESREWIGKNKHKIVKLNEYELIEQSRHTEIKQDQIVRIGGSRREMVDGSVAYKVASDTQIKVGSRYALEAGTEIHIKAGAKVVIEAPQVTLKGAGGFVDVGPIGVVIQGTMVLINSGGAPGAGSGSSPDTPAPTTPDEADDGTKFDKM